MAHIFTYMGGEDTTLRGWHSMMEVDLQPVAFTLHGMSHAELNFPDMIMLVLCGPMTPAQVARVLDKVKASRRDMIDGINWLIENNIEYRTRFPNGSFDCDSIPQPKIVNKSTCAESTNTNIELTEEMSIVFPDPTLDETTGGFQSAAEFKKVISEINHCTTTATVLSQASNYVYANKDENLVKAFPKQFPYGTGGPRQTRYNKNGERVQIDFIEYLQHVNFLSNRNFHTQDFSLITWNILEKQFMMQQASFTVKGDRSLQTKIAETQGKDVAAFITSLKNGKVTWFGNSRTAEQRLLDVVDSIPWPLPHGNQAAKQARKKAFALQLQFGMPLVFFTVTPLGTTSFTVCVYMGLKFKHNDSLADLTDDDIAARASERRTLNIKYPGIGAIWYRDVMDAVWKHIIGWDFAKGCATEKPGLYGKPIAALESTEEQTRKRSHGHCLAWIDGADRLCNALQSRNKQEVDHAKSTLIAIHDRTTSTELINKEKIPPALFPHSKDCVYYNTEAPWPILKDEQHLRDMRHKAGKHERKGVIAYCPKCNEEYTIDKLVQIFLETQNTGHFALLENNWNDNKKKLEELLFSLSTPGITRDSDLAGLLSAALRNLHGWQHAPMCFKKNAQECRYSLPTLPSPATTIELQETFESWSDWLGNIGKYNKFDVVSKRNEFDVFMNQYCRPISLSRLGSNSNSQLCINGQKAIYVTKYPTKSTQEEDEGEHENVLQYSQSRMNETRFSLESSESLSRIIGASLAHSASNVIEASLAKHLIKHRSRFRFSHGFRNIPHTSMEAELYNEPNKQRQLKHHNGVSFIDSGPLQYLNRPKIMENVTLVDFVLRYHVARICRSKEDNMYDFDYKVSNYEASNYQGLRRSLETYIPVFNVWIFPDTSEFGGSILDPNITINAFMEDYALQVLICFLPYRSAADLEIKGSHVLKFCEWYPSTFNTTAVHKILTNLQNLKNSLRMKHPGEQLCQVTTAFVDPDGNASTNHLSSNRKEKKLKYDETTKKLIDLIVQDTSPSTPTPHQASSRAPLGSADDFADLNLTHLRDKGTWDCGYKNIPRTNAVIDPFFVETLSDKKLPASSNIDVCYMPVCPPLTKQTLVEVLLQRSQRKIKHHSTSNTSPDDEPESDTDNDEPNIHRPQHVIDVNATGSPESIHLWGRQANFDDEQQRSFEILAAKFVLGFMKDVDKTEGPDSTLKGTERQEYNWCRSTLTEMVGRPATSGDGQLIMFLTGPGGSGKSEVINQLLAYSQDYCNNIQYPFNSRTILVTAYSGVAATLIHGQTLHSATYLSWNNANIDPDEKAKFQNSVRLLIVDEISLMSPNDIKTLNKKMNFLMDRPSAKYGGIDIAFMGDFRQLPPIAVKTIYDSRNLVQFCGYINCFIELHGMYRFKDDPQFGELCKRFREGQPTPEDFILLNSRIVSPTNPLPAPPALLRVACKTNSEREAINTATWLTHLETHGSQQGLVVLADHVLLQCEGAANKELTDVHTFWTCVGEDDCSTPRSGRFAPMLRLYPCCPLMMTENVDVGNNMANGTQGVCTGVKLVSGNYVHHRKVHGLNVKCVYASQIDHVLWKVGNDTKKLKPNEYKSISAKFPFPECLRSGGGNKKNNTASILLNATQIPLISNDATTGHKLQGSSVDNLYIPSWSYALNWPSVMLSRVRTLQGLFLGRALDPNADFSVPPNLLRMIRQMRPASPTPFDYEKLRL
jgi:PIF1-like helicase/Helitron helicase-like domain at N-terminus